MLAMDVLVLAAYELCVFTGPGFTTDYLQPHASRPLPTDDRNVFLAQDASLKELSELQADQLPATDVELGPEKGEQVQQRVWEYCTTCRIDKKWYSHHCFICDRCVVRMDHHCRSRA